MYLNVAVDRFHYDPKTESPLSKGLPGVGCGEIDPVRVKDRAGEILKELRVLEAAEFRKTRKLLGCSSSVEKLYSHSRSRFRRWKGTHSRLQAHGGGYETRRLKD